MVVGSYLCSLIEPKRIDSVPVAFPVAPPPSLLSSGLASMLAVRGSSSRGSGLSQGLGHSSFPSSSGSRSGWFLARGTTAAAEPLVAFGVVCRTPERSVPPSPDGWAFQALSRVGTG